LRQKPEVYLVRCENENVIKEAKKVHSRWLNIGLNDEEEKKRKLRNSTPL